MFGDLFSVLSLMWNEIKFIVSLSVIWPQLFTQWKSFYCFYLLSDPASLQLFLRLGLLGTLKIKYSFFFTHSPAPHNLLCCLWFSAGLSPCCNQRVGLGLIPGLLCCSRRSLPLDLTPDLPRCFYATLQTRVCQISIMGISERPWGDGAKWRLGKSV